MPESRRHNDTLLQNKDLGDFQAVTTDSGVTAGNRPNSLINKGCDGVTAGNGGIEEKNINQPAFNESGNLFEEEI